MRTRSASFDEAIAQSHQLATAVSVLDRDSGLSIAELDTVTGGSVTLDATASVRGRCDITLVDDGDLIPNEPLDALAPYGNELHIRRGITYSDGTSELISLGIFRIQSVEVTDGVQGQEIRISGLDRAQRASDAKFTAAYATTGAQAVDAVISEILDGIYPVLVTDFNPPDHDASKAVSEEASDRWEFAQELATSIGAELYFDGDGVLVLRPVPQLIGGSPEFYLSEGDGGVLLESTFTWNREGTYNRVIVTGENTETDAVYRGDAINDDSRSLTYYYGNFGEVPMWVNSPLVSSDAHAQQMADGLLATQNGTARQVSFGSIVNPALEPGDVVRITREGGIEDHIVDSLTIPLTADGTMSGQTRSTEVA